MFSTDFIKKMLLTTRNVRLDSGHYATKYYFRKAELRQPPGLRLSNVMMQQNKFLMGPILYVYNMRKVWYHQI